MIPICPLLVVLILIIRSRFLPDLSLTFCSVFLVLLNLKHRFHLDDLPTGI